MYDIINSFSFTIRFPMIIIDIREPKILETLLNKKDIETKREMLEIGDFLLPDEVIIERKEDDIIQSIKSGRIFNQLHHLKEYKHPILVIISKNLWKLFYRSKSKYIDKSFFGFLATCLYKFQIPIVILEDKNDFVEFLVRLHEQTTSGKKGKVPIAKIKKDLPLEKRKALILSQIRGMSYEKAVKLLDKYKSIVNIGRQPIENLMKIEGIGKKTAKYIKEELN